MKRKGKKIKINLQELPMPFMQRLFMMRIHDARMLVIDDKDSSKFMVLTMAYEMAWLAHKFLSENKQTDTWLLAKDAINEVQPEMIVRKDVNRDYCNKCSFRDDCPLKRHTDERKAQICLFIPLSYANPGIQGIVKQKPMDYSRDERGAIAEAWEIHNN